MTVPTLLTIGGTRIEIHGIYVTTILHDGKQTTAAPNMRPEDYARAGSLGYGADLVRMTIEHEVLHTLMPHLLGLPESPVMRGVCERSFWPHWRQEEAMLFGVQRYCNTVGVDVLELARRVGEVG